MGHESLGDVMTIAVLSVGENTRTTTRPALSSTGAAPTRPAARMTRPAITISPDAALAEAARRTARHRISHLPVADEAERLVGIVSRRDLLAVFVVPDEQIREAVIDEVIHHVPREHRSEVDVGVHDGVVTLSGRAERRSQIPIAVRFSHRLDGVVDVIDHLDHVHEDSLFTVLRG